MSNPRCGSSPCPASVAPGSGALLKDAQACGAHRGKAKPFDVEEYLSGVTAALQA